MTAIFKPSRPWTCREAKWIVYEQPLALPRPKRPLAGGRTPVAVKLDDGQYMIAMQDADGDVDYYGILSSERFSDMSYHLAGVYIDSDSYTRALYLALNYSTYRSGDAQYE